MEKAKSSRRLPVSGNIRRNEPNTYTILLRLASLVLGWAMWPRDACTTCDGRPAVSCIETPRSHDGRCATGTGWSPLSSAAGLMRGRGLEGAKKGQSASRFLGPVFASGPFFGRPLRPRAEILFWLAGMTFPQSHDPNLSSASGAQVVRCSQAVNDRLSVTGSNAWLPPCPDRLSATLESATTLAS